MAVYFYMPSYEGKINDHSYYCNNCISSSEDKGCSCNYHYLNEVDANNLSCGDIHYDSPDLPQGVFGKDWRWIDPYKCWINLDERGRPYPCAEYDYDKDGFDIPTWWTDLTWVITWNWFLFKESIKKWWKRHISDNLPLDRNI